MADRYSSRENEDDNHRVDRKYNVSIQEEQNKIWNRAQLCEDEQTESSLIWSDPFLRDLVSNTQNSAEEPTSQFCSLDVERSLEQLDLQTDRSLILSDPFLCDPVSNTQASPEEPKSPFCSLDVERSLEQINLSLSEREAIIFGKTEDQLFMTEQARRFLDDDK